MAPYKGLIHQYANLPNKLDKNGHQLRRFYAQFGPMGMLPSGHPASSCVRVRLLEKPSEQSSEELVEKKYLAFFDQADADHWRRWFSNNPFSVLDEIVTYPGDSEFEKVLVFVENHCLRMRGVLDACIEGIPPFTSMNGLMKSLCKFSVLTVTPGSDPWHYTFVLNSNIDDGQLPIDVYIGAKGIFFPSIMKTEINLKNTRKCVVCGQYYQARGATIIHCSETCRSRDRFGLKGRANKEK